MEFRQILIVDDNDSDLVYTEIMLAKAHIAHSIKAFGTGADTLAYLQSEDASEVDLILLDLNMPEMSGFEFLSLYQSLYSDGSVRARIAILTSSEDRSDISRTSLYPCVTHYLVKPIDIAKAKSLVTPASDQAST